MKKMPIAQAQAGDKLARDLRADDGSLILGKGSVLSQSLLVRLGRMGISHVLIESEESASVEEIARDLEQIEKRFAGHESNPFMMELKRIMRERILGSNAQTAATSHPQTGTPGHDEHV